MMEISDVQALAENIRAETAKAITGQSDMIDLMLTALFARGHILLEGPPGTAKTLTAIPLDTFVQAMSADANFGIFLEQWYGKRSGGTGGR